MAVSAGEGEGKEEYLHTAGGNVTGATTMEISKGFSKMLKNNITAHDPALPFLIY